jgi:bacillopeptidase F
MPQGGVSIDPLKTKEQRSSLMMRLAILGGMVLFAAGAARAGQIDPGLEVILEQSEPGKVISTLVYLQDRVDTAAITRQMDAQRARLVTRHETVVRALQAKAQATQVDLVAHLNALKDAGRISDFDPFWVANVIRVDATAAEIGAIAGRDDVERVYYNYQIELVAPVAAGDQGGGGGGTILAPEPGVVAVRAPEVWAMGFTGEGVLVATLDTGVDGNHPALASRWRGLDPIYSGHPEWAWFDPVSNTQFPTAFGSHGTHTMGTVCGGAPGDEVGVAPGAEWIHAAVIDRVSIPQTVADAILAFQWMVDPDENPATNFDVPSVCSNSWGLVTGHGYPPCDQTFWEFLDACEAAGIVILFSAGNEGSSGLRRPADRATDDYRTAAVAAVDGNDPSYPIAGFSSRGGEAAIKPDIAAPGVSVRSSTPGNGYGNLSGTSMASPHVNGVVALMRQANPDLSVEQVKQIIYDTALDLGTPGEDNSYGWGLVDAFEAVQMALGTVNLTFSFPDGRPDFIDPTGGTTIRVVVTGQANEPAPGTGLLYHSTDGSNYTQVSMVEVQPNVYDAVFPSFECGALVRYYFSAETEGGEVVFNPFLAPDVTYSGEAYSGINVWFQDDFEADLGWTVEDSPDLLTGTWERGVPAGGGDRGDPAQDSDGSGQCYVTGLADGDNDIDNGSTTLNSPVMDATSPEAVLSYDRWYSNTFGADPENDIFVVDVSDDGGSTWESLEVVGPSGPEVSGGWFHKEFLVADIPNISNTSQLRIRFTASDLNAGSVVEADLDGDGSVGILDLLALLDAWGTDPGGPPDFDGDGTVGINDLLALLADWGPCP